MIKPNDYVHNGSDVTFRNVDGSVIKANRGSYEYYIYTRTDVPYHDWFVFSGVSDLLAMTDLSIIRDSRPISVGK